MSAFKVAVIEVPRPYIHEVTFESWEHRSIDMAGMLGGEMFKPLHDPRFFTQAAVDPVWKTVVWPNGADLAPEFLYEPEKSRKDANGDI